ncbi:MAG: hypothetical protein V1681_02305, partial [Candidatus Neomarinimicrobiota bacterium]
MSIRNLVILSMICLVSRLNNLYAGNKLSVFPADSDSAWQAINAVKNDLIHPRELRKQQGAMLYTRPTDLPNTYPSAAGHFLIHYTLTGNNAVDSTVTNEDNVPDFVYETGQIA